MKALAARCLTLVLLCAVAAGQTSEEQQIRKSMEENNAAIRNKDTATLNRQYSEEYMRIGVNGQFMSKAEAVKNLTSSEFKLGPHTFSDVKIHVYGDVAVATGLSKYTTERNGQTTAHDERFVQVWKKNAGAWQLVIQTRTSTTPIPATAYH